MFSTCFDGNFEASLFWEKKTTHPTGFFYNPSQEYRRNLQDVCFTSYISVWITLITSYARCRLHDVTDYPHLQAKNGQWVTSHSMFKTGIPWIFLLQKKPANHGVTPTVWVAGGTRSSPRSAAQVPTKLGHYLSSCHNLQDPSKTNLDPPARSFRNPFLPVKSSKQKMHFVVRNQPPFPATLQGTHGFQ